MTAFPTLRIRRGGISAEGAFAESQAAYLDPDPRAVRALEEKLRATNAGVVAHFYMDPELQGVLEACDYPHIFVSDSLQMADRAVAMVEAGARTIVVLGVDFMTENVRAMLDAAGHERVPVYRVTTEAIGCSLAEAAESAAYARYLERAAEAPHPLHVVYINTSLRTKALAESLVPTITCTSSNVVRTVLQATAQIPDVEIFFGPDTYMGENLLSLFRSLAAMDDATIRALHPEHDARTIGALVERFHYFDAGRCIVHHLFGHDVVERVRRDHADAFVTAHLEVPGEMFALGLEAQRNGRGVVGSTSDILRFIGATVERAAIEGQRGRLAFVLGTESGMVTSIVRRVRELLDRHAASSLSVDIVFPVASEAIATTGEAGLAVVPGVAAGEGCSIAGGCATCPYMKMSSLRALDALLDRIHPGADDVLVAFMPKKSVERIRGKTLAELGTTPILHMRAFQKSGRLPDALVTAVQGPPRIMHDNTA